MLRALNEKASADQALAQSRYNEEKTGGISKRVTTKASQMEANVSSNKRNQSDVRKHFDYKKLNNAKQYLQKQHILPHEIASKKVLNIENWGNEEVSHWLIQLNLAQYCDVFIRNQINGEILLELSLDDLDYMSIKALGHRKTILRGIESLRRGIVSTNLIVSETPVATPSDLENSSSAIREVTSKAAKSNSTVKHWSHIEPLSSNVTNLVGLEENHVNSADYLKSFGTVDEESERAAFQQAVMEWRNAGKSSSSFFTSSNQLLIDSSKNSNVFDSVKIAVTTSSEKMGDGSMWKNPFVIDHEKVEAAESGISTHSEQEPTSFNFMEPSVSLAVGELNEAKEQAEFKEAVVAWRNGSETSEKKLQKVAENFSIKLEEEFRLNAQALEIQKEAAIKKLTEARAKVYQSQSQIREEFHQGLSCTDKEGSMKNRVKNRGDIAAITDNDDDNDDDDNDDDKICGEIKENEGIEHDTKATLNYMEGGIDMQMVESVIGYDDNISSSPMNCIGYYVIEYDSEDEG